MKHYRVNKLVKPNGPIAKKRDILANNDREAVEAARQDDDCPICDVLHEGKKVASIL